MKLFSYDHCPYCVKARMILGLKNVDFELITLLNDDEQTPIGMIGKKMVPILQKPDGSFLPESLDIISYIDGLDEFGELMVRPSREMFSLDEWFQKIRLCVYDLAMPRWVKMDLEEFATASARQYFMGKKEGMIGSFQQSWDRSEVLTKEAVEHLKELESLISGETFFWGETLNLDDFHVFAALRAFTTVKDLNFPPKIDGYMNSMSKKSKVPLYWEKAL